MLNKLKRSHNIQKTSLLIILLLMFCLICEENNQRRKSNMSLITSFKRSPHLYEYNNYASIVINYVILLNQSTFDVEKIVISQIFEADNQSTASGI